MYEYCRGVEQMRAARFLPNKSEFYSKLSGKEISDADYEHAQTVYSSFECKNLLEYAELYCKLDTLLLAECFIRFREDVLMEMRLDCW